MGAAFDATQWLRDLTEIGGGYALLASGEVCFIVENCSGDDVTKVMSQIAPHRDRQEQVKLAIRQRQGGEAA